MDQESGRRRSSRLAAKGVTPTPRSEVVKKTVKSSEKPKRSKRKTTEEIIELPEAKKTKTEEKKSSKEVKKSDENKTNNVDTNDISGIAPMDEDNAETNIMSPSDEEINDKPLDEEVEKTDVTDSKVIENITVTNDEKEKVETPQDSDDGKQPDVTEEVITIKDAKIAEQQKNDVPPQVPVALENTNGKNDDEENDKPVEDAVNNDTDVNVTTKDIVTSNGDSDEQVNATNGDKSGPESGTNEPKKVLHDDTNHFVETDLKAVTIPAITITNSDNSSVEQVEEELDKVVDNVVDNMNVPADDNAPIVDQSPTVVS